MTSLPCDAPDAPPSVPSPSVSDRSLRRLPDFWAPSAGDEIGFISKDGYFPVQVQRDATSHWPLDAPRLMAARHIGDHRKAAATGVPDGAQDQFVDVPVRGAVGSPIGRRPG